MHFRDAERHLSPTRRTSGPILLLAVLAFVASCADAPPPRASAATPSAPKASTTPPAEECRVLIGRINRTLGGLKSAETVEPPANLEALAKITEDAARDVAALPITQPRLRSLADAYGEMSTMFSRAAREMAAGLAAKDTTRMMAAQAALEEASAREDPLILAINTFCGK